MHQMSDEEYDEDFDDDEQAEVRSEEWQTVGVSVAVRCCQLSVLPSLIWARPTSCCRWSHPLHCVELPSVVLFVIVVLSLAASVCVLDGADLNCLVAPLISCMWQGNRQPSRMNQAGGRGQRGVAGRPNSHPKVCRELLSPAAPGCPLPCCTPTP